MIKLNVILSFAAAVAMALTAIDTVNAANLRSTEKFLTSIASDSTQIERFLQEMEGSENPEDDGGLTTGGERLAEEVKESENAEDDSDDTESERFLVELNGAAAKVSERFTGERFLQELEGSENPEDDGGLTTGGERLAEEVKESENAEDDSDDTESERFLVELNGAAAKVGERFTGERFLQELEGSENPEDDGGLTTGGERLAEEVEESENLNDDNDSTDIGVE